MVVTTVMELNGKTVCVVMTIALFEYTCIYTNVNERRNSLTLRISVVYNIHLSYRNSM